MIVSITLLAHTAVTLMMCHVSIEAAEYCTTEEFHPQCLKNDIILMKSATYGRMSVGRCVSAEEVDAHKARVGNDPGYFECSVDVLQILDYRCSGKTDCDVRVVDISKMTTNPCLPGLVVYLEANYDCVAVADEKHSCTIKASTNPTHIISSSPQQRICGREFHPWTVESPVGQRISVTLIDFNGKVTDDVNRHLCNSYATIVDREGKRNVSICGGKGQRQSKQYTSTGNTLEIYLNSIDFKERASTDIYFMLQLDAVGCSDIIPPEDTWLKRREDVIVIGCYSNRLTWKLSCSEGKWIGVLGNCSITRIAEPKNIEDESISSTVSYQEQVLTIVAISGCTFAICLVIVCVGVICLRRFFFRYKNEHQYKTLSLQRNPEKNPGIIQKGPSVLQTQSMEDVEQSFNSKQLQNYPVYFGYNDIKQQ